MKKWIGVALGAVGAVVGIGTFINRRNHVDRIDPQSLVIRLPDDLPGRILDVDGVINFRDMGGYPTIDGRTTRWHYLFRADGLQRLTEGDLELLRAYRLRTVIDLRTIGEIEEWGRFAADRYPVRFVHLPIVDATWHFEGRKAEGSPHEFLVSAYLDMLQFGADRFAQALRLLAEPNIGPSGARQLPHGAGVPSFWPYLR